jgi:protein-disulfide isomerase
MSKGTTIASVLIAFLAGSTLMCAVDKNADDQTGSAETAAASHAAAKVPVTASNPTWGNADAPVTIVEFSDFQCPWCSKVGPTLDELKKHYGPEKLRVVWKHFPLSFHQKAGPAHEASAVAYELGGNEAFWKFHDKAFENQKDLDPAKFGDWAAASGLDKAKFEEALKAKKGVAVVGTDKADASKVGVTGTPSIYVNGIKPQRRDTESMKKLIDEQLAAAKALTDAGTPPGEVYVKLSETNYKAPAPRKGGDRAKRKSPAEDKDVFKIPVAKTDPQKGSDDAIITIVEWSDFQCPFCKRVNGTIDQVQKEYGDKVRVVWKNQPLPFHGQAKPAAALAEYAYDVKGDAGFWAVHDKIFEYQKELKTGEPTLEKIAKETGLDWAKAKKAIDSGKYNADIEASQKTAAQFGARGTPHFFINGRRVPGAQPFPVFKAVIDQEIIKANALVKAGTPKSQVYAKAIADGKTSVPAPAPREQKPQGLEKKNVAAPPATSPFKGGENATIVIQEFSDFQCPFCSRVNPTLKQVQKEYGENVKIVWRNLPLPFHKEAPLAAEAALEAHVQKGNDGFWAYHDILFQNQRALSREKLDEYAAQLGLDMAAFKAALDARTHKASVDADVKAANDAGIRGTPGFTVNGYFVSGAQPFPAFKKAIEKAQGDLKKKK